MTIFHIVDINPYVARKPPAPVLGEFEQIVLLALLRIGADAYGAAVCLEIERRGGRAASLSAVHTTLERLNTKAWCARALAIRHRSAAASASVTTKSVRPGVRALQASYRSIRKMADGIEDLLENSA